MKNQYSEPKLIYISAEQKEKNSKEIYSDSIKRLNNLKLGRN